MYQEGREDALTDRKIDNKLKKAAKDGAAIYVQQVCPGYVVLMIGGKSRSFPQLTPSDAWAEIRRLRN